MKKATNIESQFRVNQIVSMFLQGVTSRADIIRYCTNEWGIEARQVDEYLAKARKYYQEISEHDSKVELGMSLARLHDLYGRCMKVQDYRTCLQIQKEIKDLLGIGAAQKIEHSGTLLTANIDTSKISDTAIHELATAIINSRNSEQNNS